jgi:predicted membrane-bound spermidine synthase
MTTLNLAANDRTNRSEGLAQRTRVLCVLFFFSGFPALIYQLVWQRTLFRIFGVNMESVTIVVTAFMLGLGFGSLAGGWLSKRRNIPLLPLLAVIETLTGTFGIISLTIFDQVGALTAGWPLPAIAAVNLGLVLVPTLLMGATLPLMVAHLVRRTEGVGSAVGLLYYVNTLGAGAACLLCAVLLFPFFGMRGSISVAVAINAAVAVGALVAHWRDRDGFAPTPADVRTSVASAIPGIALLPLLTVAAAGGFVSLRSSSSARFPTPRDRVRLRLP